MEKLDIHQIMLAQYAGRLYAISRQITLCLCREEDNLDTRGIKSDIQMIKALIVNIEMEIDNL